MTDRADVERYLYRLLLWTYPPGYRRRFGPWMQQAFEDVRRERGPGLSLDTWWELLWDWGGSWMSEWKHELDVRTWPWVAVGAAALLPGLLFFGSVILIDFLGLVGLEPARQAILGVNRSPLRRYAVEGMIVVGPLVGLALALVPWLRRRALFLTDGRTILVQSRAGRLTLAVASIGLVLSVIFVTYFFAENWACIVGQAISC